MQKWVVNRNILPQAHEHIVDVKRKGDEKINVGQVDVIDLFYRLNDRVHKVHRLRVNGQGIAAWQGNILTAYGAGHQQKGELVFVAAGKSNAVFLLQLGTDGVNDGDKVPVQLDQVRGNFMSGSKRRSSKLIHRDEHMQQ